jgi:hypothetical protein
MLAFFAVAPLSITRPSYGQGEAPASPAPSPAPAAPADDDLELPAKPAAAPAPAAPPQAAAAPADAPRTPAPRTSAAPVAATPVPATSDRVTVNPEARPASTPVSPTATTGTSIGRTSPLGTAHWPYELRVGGYIQGQYETHQDSEDQLQQGGVPLNQNRFTVRRARIRIDRDWQYARATVELDANTTKGVTVGIRRAEASVLYRGDRGVDEPPLVMLTIGVMDIPFGYELLEPTRERPFMERTTGGLALFPTDMDAGARISGSIDFFHYAVAIMNGEPLDNSGFPRDPNAAKDVIGRFGADAKPADGVAIGGGASFATGKGFHAGQDAGKNQLVWRDADQNGAFSPNEVVLVPASGATPSKNFERWALGLDLEFALQTKLGRTKVYGEGFVAQNYDRGVVPADPVLTGVDVREAGAYGAVVQDVTRYGLVGFRGGVYNPNSDLAETRRGRLLPFSQSIYTLSPVAGLVLPGTAKLLFQYDFILDKLARDSRGVPTDAKNNIATVRLQVEL